MTEFTTLINISIDNFNTIKASVDLSSIKSNEEALRFVHSLMDEYKQIVLDNIHELTSVDGNNSEEELLG